MTYGKKLGQYQKNSVETAGKMDLVIMCYDKTIQLLKQAKIHLEESEIEKKAKDMQKALAIINELQSSLNMENGGEIAVNLNAIYTYVTKRLIEGDIGKDTTALDEAVQIMSQLKEAWEKIAIEGQAQHTAASRPAATGLDGARIAA